MKVSIRYLNLLNEIWTENSTGNKGPFSVQVNCLYSDKWGVKEFSFTQISEYTRNEIVVFALGTIAREFMFICTWVKTNSLMREYLNLGVCWRRQLEVIAPLRKLQRVPHPFSQVNTRANTLVSGLGSRQAICRHSVSWHLTLGLSHL